MNFFIKIDPFIIKNFNLNLSSAKGDHIYANLNL